MSALPVTFDEDGLIPAVIQDVDTGEVLMMAYMNAEALERTRATGKTHFWSRSRRALWKKGETSGHVQLVKSIAVNCYENCLLIRVHQIGACCHTGFPTCFFREIDVDGSLVTVQERAFDPDSVYSPGGDLKRTVELWIGAYRWLADHNLGSESRTSLLLHRAPLGELTGRIAEELDELAGVLRGDHGHSNPTEDTLLEATQVLYWCAIAAMRAGIDDPQIVANVLGGHDSPIAGSSGELAAAARRWRAMPAEAITAELHVTVSLISAALSLVGLNLASALAQDTADLRAKPYLAPYFAPRQGASLPDS